MPQAVMHEANLSASLHARLRSQLAHARTKLVEHHVAPPIIDTWDRLVTVVERHMAMEESSLYPLILSCPAQGELADGLTSMAADHAEIHQLLDKIRAADLGLARKDVLAALGELEEHARMEDEILLPCGEC